MNTIEKLALAEAIAAEHNRWHEFSRLYTNYRDTNKVMPSITLTLTDMNLYEQFCERLR